MRCDASWRGGESCFSPVCCSLQLEEEEMCPPLPLLICCLFCFLSVPSPKRFGKVQISVLTAQCSKRKGEKQKGWRRGEDGGGEETQPLALARLEEHGDGRPGQGLPWGPGGVWWPLSPGSPWHHFGHVCSDAPLERRAALLAMPRWRGGLEKQGLFLLLQNVGWSVRWKTKGILTLCSRSWDVKICIASSWFLAFPQHPGHVGKVQDLGVLGQKAGESSGIKNCDIPLNRTRRPSPGKLKHLSLLLHYCKQQQKKGRQKLYRTMSVSFFQDK